MVQKRQQTILETRSCESACRNRTQTIDRGAVINHYEENPRHSLRKGAACLDITVSVVRSAVNKASMKSYHPKTIRQFKPTDIANRREFVQAILDKINKECLNFVKFVLFFNEAVLRLQKANPPTIFLEYD